MSRMAAVFQKLMFKVSHRNCMDGLLGNRVGLASKERWPSASACMQALHAAKASFCVLATSQQRVPVLQISITAARTKELQLAMRKYTSAVEGLADVR